MKQTKPVNYLLWFFIQVCSTATVTLDCLDGGSAILLWGNCNFYFCQVTRSGDFRSPWRTGKGLAGSEDSLSVQTGLCTSQSAVSSTFWPCSKERNTLYPVHTHIHKLKQKFLKTLLLQHDDVLFFFTIWFYFIKYHSQVTKLNLLPVKICGIQLKKKITKPLHRAWGS